MRMEFVFFVFGMCAACVFGCSQFPAGIRSTDSDTPEPDEVRVYYSQYVVFGEVGAAVPPPTGAVAGVEAVQFDIICMYKGTPQPSSIKVYGIGNSNGELPGCPSVSLVQGEKVILFLKRRADNYFQVEFAPLQGEVDVFVDDLSLVCRLELTFPTDLSSSEEDPEGLCMAPLPPGDCMLYEPPTTQKPPVTPKQIETDGEDTGYDTKNGGKTGKVGNDESGASRLILSSGLVLLTALLVTIL